MKKLVLSEEQEKLIYLIQKKLKNFINVYGEAPKNLFLGKKLYEFVGNGSRVRTILDMDVYFVKSSLYCIHFG